MTALSLGIPHHTHHSLDTKQTKRTCFYCKFPEDDTWKLLTLKHWSYYPIIQFSELTNTYLITLFVHVLLILTAAAHHAQAIDILLSTEDNNLHLQTVFSEYDKAKKYYVSIQKNTQKLLWVMRFCIFNFINRKTAMCNHFINRRGRHSHTNNYIGRGHIFFLLFYSFIYFCK